MLKSNDDIIIIAIFIKLLEIKIVANNILGSLINLRINLCFFESDSFSLFLSEGESAKNAISDPEIKPDPIKRKTHDKNGVKKL